MENGKKREKEDKKTKRISVQLTLTPRTRRIRPKPRNTPLLGSKPIPTATGQHIPKDMRTLAIPRNHNLGIGAIRRVVGNLRDPRDSALVNGGAVHGILRVVKDDIFVATCAAVLARADGVDEDALATWVIFFPAAGEDDVDVLAGDAFVVVVGGGGGGSGLRRGWGEL